MSVTKERTKYITEEIYYRGNKDELVSISSNTLIKIKDNLVTSMITAKQVQRERPLEIIHLSLSPAFVCTQEMS